MREFSEIERMPAYGAAEASRYLRLPSTKAKRWAEALCTHPFERHQDHFSPGTPDTEWLPYIGQRGWILLTSDRRIRHRFSEWIFIQRY